MVLSGGVEGGFVVAYRTSDGTATTADGDYTDNDSSLAFTGTSGETKTVTVQVNHDGKVEADETFTLSLGSAVGATIDDTASSAEGIIVNDDAPAAPELSIAATDAVKLEGNDGSAPATEFSFTVTREAAGNQIILQGFTDPAQLGNEDFIFAGDATGESTVTWTVGGIGPNPADDQDVLPPFSDTLTFLPGETEKTVTIQVNGDLDFEPDEGFTVTLSEPTGARLGGQAAAIGTIRDDDAEGGNSIYVSDVQVEEGAGGTATDAVFTVSLSTPVDAPVTVDFATADGTADAGTDYTAVSGTLTFAPGETVQTITVPITGTFTKEPIGFAVRKGDFDTLNYFNNWIRVTEAKGWLAERKQYWFETKDWEDKIK